ncbi:hypothetical protein KGF56_000239 [Candida oxycetoniae]|uniref:PRELI/MSF1 domain-containing protein n=1 Tax=Candida oxycetoniae TaxID=497107 RepID=A0AAI9T240_9ASCO|nr:uncharacterized protein KGF56_000239 [Candida oxycetoniae]KAI3406946.2 hypothetical protein KGF56_000239 [Candida oxycetoniae]
MVLFFETKQDFNFDFETTSLAYLNRYPNPYAKHVLSADTLDYQIDSHGQLCTTRLIVKTGRLPKFIRPFLGVSNVNSWILEKLVINPKTNTLHSYTSNIDHRRFIKVEEYLKYKGDPVSGSTTLEAKVKFSSNFFGLKSKIEEWSHSRFSTNIQNSRDGLHYVMTKLKQRNKAV